MQVLVSCVLLVVCTGVVFETIRVQTSVGEWCLVLVSVSR